MVSRENAVILVSLALGIVAYYAVETFLSQPAWVGYAVLIVVGVIVPTLVNESLGRE